MWRIDWSISFPQQAYVWAHYLENGWRYTLGVSLPQRCQTSDLAVMGSIPGTGVIGHLGQLSLPSLLGR